MNNPSSSTAANDLSADIDELFQQISYLCSWPLGSGLVHS